MKIVRHALLLMFVALAGQVMVPSVASACIWNPLHGFSPLPPCNVRDSELVKQTKEMNRAIMNKIALASSKIAFVQQEIAAWYSVIDGASNYVALIERVYVDGIPSPLPALVAEFNRQSPTSRYVWLDGGGFRLVNNAQEIFRLAGEISQSLRDPEGVAELYDYRINTAVTNSWDAAKNTVAHQLAAAFDYQQYVHEVTDRIYPTAERTSQRYVGVSDDGGLAEAAISDMSATLSGLIGLSAETEALSHEMRMSAVRGAMRRRWDRARTAALLESISF